MLLITAVVSLHAQEENLEDLFKVDYDTPLTIDLDEELEEEEEQGEGEGEG